MQDEMTSEKQETEEASPPPAKKSKVDDHRDTETIQHNADGDPYIDLSSKKRLTVRTWKGSVLIDIREVDFSYTFFIWNTNPFHSTHVGGF
jgi:hypothetical protein